MLVVDTEVNLVNNELASEIKSLLLGLSVPGWFLYILCTFSRFSSFRVHPLFWAKYKNLFTSGTIFSISYAIDEILSFFTAMLLVSLMINAVQVSFKILMETLNVKIIICLSKLWYLTLVINEEIILLMKITKSIINFLPHFMRGFKKVISSIFNYRNQTKQND